MAAADFRERLIAARNKDREERFAAFLPSAFQGRDIPCEPLTAARLILLTQSENRFVNGGEITPEDVAGFLWICSPKFKPCPRSARRHHRKIYRRKPADLLKLAEAIRDYIAETLATAPSSGDDDQEGDADPSIFPAMLVDRLADAYGWSETEILQLPLSRAFQYIEQINSRMSENHVSRGRHADTVKNDFLADANAAHLQQHEHDPA